MRSYVSLAWLLVSVSVACGGGDGGGGAGEDSSGGIGGGGRSGSGGSSGIGGQGGQPPFSGVGGIVVPVDERCIGEGNCVGTQSCTGDDCTACACSANELAPIWTVTGPDYIWDMAGAPDGSVYLLLGREPWVQHHAAQDGATLPFSSRATLDWASEITVGSDGSVYVAGEGTFGGTTKTVQVQQLDSNGELIATARWPGELGATFAGIVTAPDGTVFIAAHALAAEDDIFNVSDLMIARLSGEELVDLVGPFEELDFAFGDDANPNIYDARLRAAGADGSFVLGGVSDDYDTWLGFIAGGSAVGGILVAGSLSDATLSEVTPDGAGGWYWGYGTGWTNSLSGIGSFNHHVFRASADGTEQWSKHYRKERQDRSLSDGIMRGTSVVGLDDSVVFALGSLQGLEGTESLAPVSRFGRDGALLNTVQFSGAVRAVATGERSVVLKSAMQIALVTFPPFELEQLADGAACTNAEVCDGGLCCLGVGGGPGTCASEGCGAGSLCSDAIACVASDCLIAATETQGYCAPPCTASAECPPQQFCAGGHCHASCSESEQCTDPGTQCLDAMNAEDQLVTVCVAPDAADAGL